MNAVTGITSYYIASPLTAFIASTPILRLADYGIDITKISGLSGCEISTDDNYLLLTGDGTASYNYDVDGENGEHTLSASIGFPTGIEINEENFPDVTFRTYVDESFDTTNDNILTADEIEVVTEIDLWSPGITTVTDLTGVEYFTALESLNCSINQLTSLDVSNNTALKYLWCSNNQLTDLDVSGCTALETLYCYSNKLTSLDVSSCTALKTLHCYENQLTSLNVSSCTALKTLYCYSNKLTSLDVSDCTALETLYCHSNQLTSLDVSDCTALKALYCHSNKLTSLDVSDCTALQILSCYSNKLTSLNVDGCAALETLDCSDNNQLESLDVSDCTALKALYCYSNQLTSLDVSKNAALEKLHCYSNQLTSLDVSKNTALENLNCYNNQLTSLDVSKNTALEKLDCRGNLLKSLDVSDCTALTNLLCSDNQLQSLDLTKNTALIYLFCMNNPLLAVNAVTGITSYYNASPLNAFAASTPILRLADYGIKADMITSLTGCKLSTDGNYLLLTGNGTASYTYDVDGENGEHTLSASIEFPADIEINEENFPDETFRTYVDENFDTTDNNILTADEIEVVTRIFVSDMGITNLTGVEFFTALTTLYCSENQLTSLDVSKNTALTTLSCSSNQLTSLDVSKNTALTELYCNSNQLTSLDVSKNTALTDLDCYDNKLTSLDVSKNTALSYLSCYSNQLTSLDVSNNTALSYLYCVSNQLTSLDVSNNTALTQLNCFSNQLTSLNVSSCTALTELYCYNNQLESLDVSDCTALETLYCNSNKLTSLNISNNTALENLDCYENQLTSLDVSQNTNLNNVDCSCNSYSIDLVGGTFDLSTLPEGFDVTKVSVWFNATVEGDILTVSDPTSDISYTYELGNGNTEVFTLTPVSCTLTEDMVSAMDDQTYSGEALEPVKIVCGGYTLVKDTDYTISYENNVNAGTATATIKGIGEFYKGEATVNFTINPMDISGAEITLGDALIYNGSEQTQTIDSITVNGFTLTENDYIITGNTATNADDSYTLTISGTGNFTGEAYVGWSIAPKPIHSVTIDVTAPAAGETPQITVEAGEGYAADIQWIPSDAAFGYNSVYEAAVILTPDYNHVFDENTTAEGFEVTLNEDGTLTLTKEFEATAKAKITSLAPPEDVTLTEYYTAADDVIALLPTTIEIEAEDGTSALAITWELFGEFNTASNAENTFAWTADIGELDENGFETSGTITVTNVEYIVINEENFPDEIFRTYVDTNFDTTDDDVLDSHEIAAATAINVSNMGITDLTGVEHFTALIYLSCYSNQLTGLDLSKNTALTNLECYNNQLTSLDVSKNTALKTLSCDFNQLTSFDVSNNAALEILYCNNNQLTSLDVSQNTALTELNCSSNQLTDLDVSQNTALTELNCYSNQLTSLDVSNNTALIVLECNYNELTILDVSQNTMLESLIAYNNQLTRLDVSGCTALIHLDVDYNCLTSLDLSRNTALETLYCDVDGYEIDLIGGTFDLTALPEGFDVTKASEWTNATVEGDTLTVSDPTADVTYVYDLGNGSTEVFTLTPVSCTLTEDMIQPIGTQTYTGEPIRPVVLKYGDYTLVEDTDYNIGYALNVEAGTSAVNITAIGDFWKGELTTEFVIEKAAPDYVIPADLTATYGDTLADVALPEGFAWEDDTQSVGNAGTNTFMVTFTPEDTNNYEIIENISISIPVDKADPIVTPLLIGTEFFEGDVLPEITVSDDSTLGWIEWAADVEFLEAGENILEWHYTPEDTDNYNEMTGTMIIEAQTTTTTTTETTTSTTTTTDDGISETTTSTTTTTDDDISETTTSTTTTTDDGGSETTTSTTTTTDDDISETTTSTTTTTDDDISETTTSTTTTDDDISETTTSTTTTTTDDDISETTTSTTTTTTDDDISETTTSTTDDDISETTTSTTTTTDDGGSETTTSTTTTDDGASETTTSTTTTDDDISETTTSTTTTTDDGGSETTTSTTTTAPSTETTPSTATHIASDEELCDWAVKDYEKKTGVTPENAEIEYTADGNAVITLTDAEGNVLDVYNIDPFTGVGSESDGGEVNLPQTGYSVVYNYIMFAAAAMVLFGIYAMAKSRKAADRRR